MPIVVGLIFGLIFVCSRTPFRFLEFI
jgi:hypothetical protein